MYDTLIETHRSNQSDTRPTYSRFPCVPGDATNGPTERNNNIGFRKPENPQLRVPLCPMPDTNAVRGESFPPYASSPLQSPYGTEDLASKCDKKRPLSISSTSSAFSSASSSTSSSSSSLSSFTSSLPRCPNQKKSFLASIESLEDDEDLGDSCAKTNSSSGVSDGSSARSGWTAKTSSSGISHCSVISSPQPPHCKPKYCDPNLSYTERVVLEIMETERTYVRDLSEIIEGYLSRLKSGCLQVKISQASVDDLFGNIEDIYRFNRGFLQELERCSLNPVSVAQTFVKHNEGFAIYTQYCTNYPRTVSVLTDLMRREETAEVFKERQSALSHMLPLGSYLLKPVQRILKYHLLLQSMAKHYEKEKAGYEDVVNALATMTGIAHHINNMKRKHEHAIRVQEIQSLLYGWQGEDLTTYGELIAEGTFRVYGAKAVRHVFLFDKMVLIAKKKEDSSLSYKTHIMCSNLMLIESISGEPLCFHVIPFDNPRVQYTLQARNLEQKREWTLQLKRVILENYNVDIPSHARELVMQLGQNRPEDEVLAERGSASKKQHSAPEYLERRKQEKEKRLMDNVNRALRIRSGSKKRNVSSPSNSLPPSDVCGEHDRSPSCDRKADKGMHRKMSASSLPTSHKVKKLRGWRRKSEPCDLLSSQESLTRDPSFDQSPAKKGSCPNTPGPLTRSCSQASDTSIEDARRLSGMVKEETTDTENEDRPSVGRDYNGDSSRRESQELSDEYVTFFFAQQHLRSSSRARQGADSHIYDVPCAHLSAKGGCATSPAQVPRYDNLFNVWAQTCTNRLVKRVQSFNSSNCSSDCSCSHPSRPDVLNLPGGPQLPDGSDSTGSPTTPAIWLKQQQGHLAEGSIKAGSLPRSFQLNQDSPDSSSIGSPQSSLTSPMSPASSNTDGLATFKLRRLVDRPFTIASDKPSQSDLNLDDFERYIEDSPTRQPNYRFPVPRDECEDHGDAPDATAESTEDLTDVHPEHRIYRPSLSRSSLRSLIASVGARLVGAKGHTAHGAKDAKDNCSCSCSSINTEGDDKDSNGREKTTNRLMVSVTHAYSRMMRYGSRSQLKSLDREPSPSTAAGVTIHKQGSPAIGARMALPIPNQDPMTPCQRRGRRDRKLRPDSTLSLASNWTSSSDCAQSAKLVSMQDVLGDDMEDSEDGAAVSGPEVGGGSDASADSYYERSFEAIESFLENEMFRDSAIYSDSEDAEPVAPESACRLEFLCTMDQPADVELETPLAEEEASMLRRVRGLSILEKVRHLEQCTHYSRKDSSCDVENLKPIKERFRDLEMWREGGSREDEQGQLAVGREPPTQECSGGSSKASPVGTEPSIAKGWVRHVVDKFQSDC